MECKIFIPLEACNSTNHVVDRRPKKGAKCSHYGTKYAVWVLSFLVILLVVAVAHLYSQVYRLHIALGDSLAKDVVAGCDGAHVTGTPGFNKLSVIDVEEYDNEQEIRLKRSRGRLNDLENQIEHIKGAILKPVVHLRGNRGVTVGTVRTSVYNVPACRNNGCFRWSLPDGIYANNFRYIRDTANNKVVGVNITSPGVYYIYSQVGVNGPRQGYDPSVGYETVRTDSTGRETVLLKTFATQDERGKKYHGIRAQFPHDSLNQFGMFKFYCHDVIVVRQVSSSNPPNFVFDEFQSYFGIVQINPTDGSLQGNYDCNSP